MGDEEETEKKLPYFHRTLNAHDASLVGKNQPIAISEAEAKSIDTQSDEKLTTASAWNAAGSWEDRDATGKCSAKLKEILEGALEELSEPLSGVGNTALVSCEIADGGTANVTHSRGKVRYMYEFTLDFKYECEVDGTSFKGTLKAIDMTNDQDEDDYEVQQEWAGSRPSAKPWGDKIRKALTGSEFKEALKVQMAVFEKAFRQLYQ